MLEKAVRTTYKWSVVHNKWYPNDKTVDKFYEKPNEEDTDGDSTENDSNKVQV
jgi:hypothetical protein